MSVKVVSLFTCANMVSFQLTGLYWTPDVRSEFIEEYLKASPTCRSLSSDIGKAFLKAQWTKDDSFTMSTSWEEAGDVTEDLSLMLDEIPSVSAVFLGTTSSTYKN